MSVIFHQKCTHYYVFYNICTCTGMELWCEAVQYNEEREEQTQWHAKVKELERIEAKKKKAEEKSEFTFISFVCVLFTLYQITCIG